MSLLDTIQAFVDYMRVEVPRRLWGDPTTVPTANKLWVTTGVGLGATAKTPAEMSLQPLDATLTALAGMSTTAGLLAQTAADTFAPRTLTGAAGQIIISNPAGIAGNPTFSIDNNYAGATRRLSAPASPVAMSGLSSQEHSLYANTTYDLTGWGTDSTTLRVFNNNYNVGAADITVTLNYTGGTFLEVDGRNGTHGVLGTNSVAISLRAGEFLMIKPGGSNVYRVHRSFVLSPVIGDFKLTSTNTTTKYGVSFAHASGAGFTANTTVTFPAANVNLGTLSSVATTDSNVLTGTNTRIEGGTNNTVSGTGNEAINCKYATLSGTNNTAIQCGTSGSTFTGGGSSNVFTNCYNFNNTANSGCTFTNISDPGLDGIVLPPYTTITGAAQYIYRADCKVYGSETNSSVVLQNGSYPLMFIDRSTGQECASHIVTIIGKETTSPYRMVIARRRVDYYSGGTVGGAPANVTVTTEGTDVVSGGMTYTISITMSTKSMHITCENTSTTSNTNWEAYVASIYDSR